MDNRGRNFDIYVDGTKIAGEDLNKYKGSKFYDVVYPIPQDLTNGKTKTVIKFIPKPNNSAGPVYGAKMVKGDVSGLINAN